jgi:hypothetical protein
MNILTISILRGAMRLCVAGAALVLAHAAEAREEVIQPPEQFVAEVVGQADAKPEVLWLTRDLAAEAGRILGHAPMQLRQRYWKVEGRTVWVLDEIGKEEPITAGFIVDNGKIRQARVLVYRESRGGEIRYPAFLKQYEGTALDGERQLDRNIDGISGATLSVRAMGRMARLALYFDQLARGQK